MEQVAARVLRTYKANILPLETLPNSTEQLTIKNLPSVAEGAEWPMEARDLAQALSTLCQNFPRGNDQVLTFSLKNQSDGTSTLVCTGDVKGRLATPLAGLQTGGITR